ncbi:MAG TPA: MurR/RpiR family transcriptional regulator [Candidatus Limnocylindrales bacterium]|nr:MurR/RpiR family transcriptional regulator [Candidatus Limnocylindrales bacterium]
MPKTSAPASVSINLAERIEQLSTKRQEIIRPILEHPREYVLLSVRALARRLHSDPATVVRIVHGLGFESYKHFQRHLHELSLAFATSLDSMQQAGAAAVSNCPARDSIFRDLKNLQALKNSLDPKRFSTLAKRLYAARRIVIIGGDLAAVLAEYLGYHLTLLGLPVVVATSTGSVTHTVRSLSSKDLVIAISFRRGLRQTIEGAQQARRNGAYCVGITDTYVSPLARTCQEIFLASVESVSFGASYAAPVAFFNAMLTAIGAFRRSRTMEIVREVDEEQRKGSRWYPA